MPFCIGSNVHGDHFASEGDPNFNYIERKFKTLQLEPTNASRQAATMEHLALTLGFLTATGGIMGYARKGSVPSLAAGLAFGGLYGYSGYLLRENRDNGLEIALGASAVMLATGIARGIPSRFKKPVPLVLTVLGSIGSAYYYKKYKEFYP